MRIRTVSTVVGVPIAVDSILLAGLLVVLVGHPAGPGAPDVTSAAAAHPGVNDSEAVLEVNPPSFWMRSGENVSLEADWTVGSPLCEVSPLWYEWSLDFGNATGFLNTTSGSTATFTAASFGSGSVTVQTQSGATLSCGDDEAFVERTFVTNLSVAAPLVLSNVGVFPNPLLPGETATLDGTIVGGEAPYSLTVSWGDGSFSPLNLSVPGRFSLDHRFASGDFVASVAASDDVGELANAVADESVAVGTGLEVGILSNRASAEVGLPVEFTGVTEGPTPGSVELYDCSNGTEGPLEATPNGTSFTCTFTSAGTAEVLFGVYPTLPGGPYASAVLYEPVVVPPRAATNCVEPVGEVGAREFVQVGLVGGVFPVGLSWNLSGSRVGGDETLWADGNGVIPVPLTEAGEYTVDVRVRDATGISTTNWTPDLIVEAPLESSASGASALLPSGAIAEVDGNAFSGCPPFTWWVVPNLDPSNGSAGQGTIGNVGDFAWNGSYAIEGNLSISVGILDGCGATWQTELEVPLVPPLSVTATSEQDPSQSNETLVLNLSVEGGLPPFRLDVLANDGEAWNRTIPTDGSSVWWLATEANRSLELTVLVSDLLGREVSDNLSVDLVSPANSTTTSPPTAFPPTPSVPGSGSSPTSAAASGSVGVLLAAIAFAGAGGAVLCVRRRRARASHPVAPAPDPVATLRGIIAPADGAERFTVELLAEEAGIPMNLVRTTIDRLVSEGVVSSESGADGEEVLSWSSESK